MSTKGLRKCRNCGTWFKPHAQNAYHQQFCAALECRQASRKVAQDEWRRRHPGQQQNKRWRRAKAYTQFWSPTGDVCPTEVIDEQKFPRGRNHLLAEISAQLRDLLALQYHSLAVPAATGKRSTKSNRSSTNAKTLHQSLKLLSYRFLEKLEVLNYADQTVYNYHKYLQYFRFFCEEHGITHVSQVTKDIILSYQHYLFRRRKKNGRPLAVGTQRYLVKTVSSFFAFLCNEGLIAKNPAANLDMPREETRLPKTVFTADEVEAVIKVPDIAMPIGLRDRALLETLYSTGIRRTELCNLNIDSVDFDRRVLRIEQGKGKKDRFVPIGERALKWIKKYLNEARPDLCRKPDEQALFLNTQHRRITPGRTGSQVRDLIDQAAIHKTGSCHIFRHTFATLLMENGCHLRHIQIMLGHSKMETTARYTHIALHEVKHAHQRYHPAGR